MILDPPGNPAESVKVQASFSACYNTKGGENMSVTVLPTFKDYTVDMRLKEFRRAIPDVTLEFIPLNSPEDKKLLEELKSFAQEIISFESDK